MSNWDVHDCCEFEWNDDGPLGRYPVRFLRCNGPQGSATAETAAAMVVEAEREAIVKWLREDIIRWLSDQSEKHGGSQWQPLKQHAVALANDIEAGAHHKQEEAKTT